MISHPEQILETCIYVDNLDEAEKSSCDILGVELIRKTEARHLFFRLGRSIFLIFNPEVTSDPNIEHDIPTHGVIGPCHTAFAVKENEIDESGDHFGSKGVAIEKNILGNSGGISLYFRAPAGNSIELGTPALWENKEKLFLNSFISSLQITD